MGGVYSATPAAKLPIDSSSRKHLLQNSQRFNMIVNEHAFHQEVLAGLLHALAPNATAASHLHLALHPSIHSSTLRGLFPGGSFPATRVTAVTKAGWLGGAVAATGLAPGSVALAVFLSPEYSPAVMAEFVNSMRPQRTVAFIHNANPAACARADAIAGVKWLALAPHVAKKCNALIGHEAVSWALPVLPPLLDAAKAARGGGFESGDPLLGKALPVPGGVCIQGNFESKRCAASRVSNFL